MFFVLICAYFLFCVLENPVILFDDVWDYIVSDFNFYHGRIISELIGISVIKLIPNILHINPQDFAIVSENLFKIVIFSLASWFVVNDILKIKIDKNCIWGPIYLLIFSFFYVLPYSSAGGNLLFGTLMFFCCYILPIPFFVLLISKIYDVYIHDIDLTKKDSISLVLLSIFVMQANEMVGIITFILLFCIYIEHIIKNKKSDKEQRKFKLFPQLLSMIVANIIVYSSTGFKMMFRDYYDSHHPVLSFNNFVHYAQICIDKIIFENWYIVIPLLIGLIVVVLKRNKETSCILKFSLYSLIGIIVLALCLYCMGPTCHYAVGNEKNYVPYWILYSPVATIIQVFLFELVLFLIVYLFNKNNRLLSCIISLILVLGCLYHMIDYKWLIDYKIYADGQRRRQYLIDKMMVFYSKKDKIAILPKDDLAANYSITPDNQMMPYEVLLGTDNNKVYGESIEYSICKPFYILRFPKIYYSNMFLSKFPYLESQTKPQLYFINRSRNFNLPIFPYIKELYKIEVTAFITFSTEEEAISLFLENGGILTEEELSELKFAKILD